MQQEMLLENLNLNFLSCNLFLVREITAEWVNNEIVSVSLYSRHNAEVGWTTELRNNQVGK